MPLYFLLRACWLRVVKRAVDLSRLKGNVENNIKKYILRTLQFHWYEKQTLWFLGAVRMETLFHIMSGWGRSLGDAESDASVIQLYENTAPT